LADGQTALIVPKRDGSALAERMIDLIDQPVERARLAQAARDAARHYDIATFVRKMERLYVLLHDVSRATNRRGVLDADLSFLSAGVLA
jgi:glycosyltransferase involved in cell wall biosynthesis